MNRSIENLEQGKRHLSRSFKKEDVRTASEETDNLSSETEEIETTNAPDEHVIGKADAKQIMQGIKNIPHLRKYETSTKKRKPEKLDAPSAKKVKKISTGKYVYTQTHFF